MLERLEEIDTSAIVELAKIREQRRVLAERLNTLAERKDSVSPAVYDRVRADYEARSAALADGARPFREQAAAEYAKLGALLSDLGAELDEARLTQEEVELRHNLGEFDGGEFDRRLGEAKQIVDHRESDLAEAHELRARFVDVFEFADGLPVMVNAEAQAADGKPDAADAGGGEVSYELVDESETPATPAETAAPQEEGTAGAESEQGKSPITAPLSVARLVLRSDEESAAEFPLQPGTTTIGRSPRNDICIREASVSRRHAKIVFARRGFVVYDLGSENGVFVNGERVRERLLAEGDEVEFGPGLKPYLFCGP